MKTMNIKHALVALLCAACAGFTACDVDPIATEGGKLPDKETIENTYGMLRSGNSTENFIDLLLTEGSGFVTSNFYFQLTQPSETDMPLEVKIDGSLLDEYNGTQEIERALFPDTNCDFPDGKAIDLSKEASQSALKRIRFSSEGLVPGEYVLPLTVAAGDAPADNRKTLYYNITIRERYKGTHELDRNIEGMYPEEDVDEPLFLVFYINTNEYSPLLVTDYWMLKKKRKPAKEIWERTIGNIINLRTVTLDYNAATNRVSLDLGSDMKYVLSHASKYIWPLQEEGRKVCLSLEGGGKGIGFCNLTDAQIENLVAEIKAVVKEYNLDGINLWDRNTGYGKEGMPAMNTASYPKLIKALREVLGTEKLLTVTDHKEPTEYFWDTDATGGIEVGQYIDYAWSGYFNGEEKVQILDPWHPENVEVSAYTHKPFAGLDPKKYGCVNVPWYKGSTSTAIRDFKHVIRWRLAGNKPSNILVFEDLRTSLQDAYEGTWDSSFSICAPYADDGKTGTGVLNTNNNYTPNLSNLTALPNGEMGYGKWLKDW